MNRVILILMLFLMCFQGAWAQSADVQAERHLMSAKKYIELEYLDFAIREFKSVLKLNVKVSNDFYFNYGKTLIQNHDFETGKKMIEKFISLSGSKDKMHKPALELLAEVELYFRLSREWLEREAIVKKSPDVSHSDQHTDKTFKAISKEWRVGKYNISWSETQSWISSLGGGWRTPALAELKSLYSSVGRTSAIGWDLVWAEIEDDKKSKAYTIDFLDGKDYSEPIGDRSDSCEGYRSLDGYRAVAVR